MYANQVICASTATI